MPVSLENALKNYDISTLGSKKGLFLAYEKKEGWKVRQLNLIKRLVRKLLGVYGNTHLATVAHQLSAEQAENKYPALTNRLYSAWNKAHPTRKIVPQDPAIAELLKPQPKKTLLEEWIAHLWSVNFGNSNATVTRKVIALREFLEQKKAAGVAVELLKTLQKPHPSQQFTKQLDAAGKALGVPEFARIEAEDAEELAAKEDAEKLAALRTHLNSLLYKAGGPDKKRIDDRVNMIFQFVRQKTTCDDFSPKLMQKMMALDGHFITFLMSMLDEIGQELNLDFAEIDAKIEVTKLVDHLDNLILQASQLSFRGNINDEITDRLEVLKYRIHLEQATTLSDALKKRISAMYLTPPQSSIQELNEIGALLHLPFDTMDSVAAKEAKMKYISLRDIVNQCEMNSTFAFKNGRESKKWLDLGSALKAKYLQIITRRCPQTFKSGSTWVSASLTS